MKFAEYLQLNEELYSYELKEAYYKVSDGLYSLDTLIEELESSTDFKTVKVKEEIKIFKDLKKTAFNILKKSNLGKHV